MTWMSWIAAPGRGSAQRALDFVVGALVLLAAVLALPLGLDRPSSAALVGGGYALDPALARAPLAALAVRAFACLPVGDLATRANLASAAAGALAAVLLARLVAEILAATRDAPVSGGGVGDTHELVAAAAGALVPVFCLDVFLSLTAATAAATTLALVAAGWLRAVRLLRHSGRTRDGLALALLAGVAVAADPVALLLLVPLAAALWFWSLRRGERWPLLGPLLLVAGMGLALYAAPPAAGHGAGAGLLAAVQARFAEAWPAGGFTLDPARRGLSQLGVVAALVVLDGLVILILRAPGLAALAMASAAVALRLAGAQAGGASAFVVLLAVAAVPLAVGIAHLVGRLGPARGAAALVVAVVALCGPALDGGARRWTRRPRVPERLLAAAHTSIAPRQLVTPGSEPMTRLLEYGRTLGLRPDLSLTAKAPPPTPPALTYRAPVPAAAR
jgi:hypothetical protein